MWFQEFKVDGPAPCTGEIFRRPIKRITYSLGVAVFSYDLAPGFINTFKVSLTKKDLPQSPTLLIY